MFHPSTGDSTLAFLAGRAIKLVANCLRPAFYLHYWIFPRQRFCLSSSTTKELGRSAEDISTKTLNNEIPKIVWQTNHTSQVTLPIKTAWLCNRLLSSGFAYQFHTTEMCTAFVERHFPGEVSDLYRRLSVGAAKADLWRLLVLYRYGGAYIDIDAHLIWPLNRIITSKITELFLCYKDSTATNYFIASRPRSPIIKALIDEVLNRIKYSQSNNVYKITGPAVFEDILKSTENYWRFSHHTCLQGNFSNKFFQYIDKPEGHWTLEQTQRQVVNP